MKYAKILWTALNKVLSKKFGFGELVVLGIIAVSTISYALAWQAPGGNPPAGNVYAPLNVGDDSQYKNGTLGVGGLIRGYGNLYIDGNVGIGTASADQKLTVAGTIESKSGGFKFPDGTIQITAATGGGTSSWITNGTSIYYNNGNVGIGTANPQAKFEVNGELAANLNGYRVTLKTINLGEDSYGGWEAAQCTGVRRCSSFGAPTDSCNNNYTQEYFCSSNDSKSCVDYKGPSSGDRYKRSVQCKRAAIFTE